MANLILWNSYNDEDRYVRNLSSYQLASWIRQHGYTVKVIEFCHQMTTDELVTITEKHIDKDTLAIGVSCTFWARPKDFVKDFHIEPAWVVSARSALKDKKLYWLLGGSKSKAIHTSFDWVKFHGMGEDSLLKWMDENSSRLVRRESFDIKTSSLLYSADDYIKPSETLSMELGRGCQFKCTFCSYPLVGKKKGTYLRDYNLIKEELIRNYNEYGTTNYRFIDDTVNESEEKIYALADIAQHLPFELNWTGYNRLDLIWSRPGTIKALSDSGLRSAFFGIESFHPMASKSVGKGWSGKHGKDFILSLRDKWDNKISYFLSFIIGLPGEDRDSVMSAYRWCIDNKISQWSFPALSINAANTRTWNSKLDAEYASFGYSFPVDTVNWKNKYWTYAEAAILSDEIEATSLNYVKPAAFLLLDMVGLGYSFEKIMNTRKKDLDWAEIKQKIENNVQEYVSFQLK